MCLSFLFLREGKEKGSRKKKKKWVGALESRRRHGGRGMPDNDVMCDERLSGRDAAWRTILPAIIKGRQALLSLSLRLPSRYRDFHLNI